MNRNSAYDISQVPSVDIQRSRIDRSHGFKFSANVGEVIPVYVDPDILPGDTVTMDTSKVIRFQTMLTPIMDSIHADFYWFFCPHRLVWTHWPEFMGENNSSAWLPQVTYTTPKLVIHEKTYTDASSRPSVNKVGSILDYMGFPVEMSLSGYTNSQIKVNALPYRAYAEIMNTWFRSENLTNPINVYKGDADQEAVSYGSYVEDVARGGSPFVACKDFDFYTACLPNPQKGPTVNVTSNSSVVRTKSNEGVTVVVPNTLPNLKFRNSTGISYTAGQYPLYTTSASTAGPLETQIKNSVETTGSFFGVTPTNLWADPVSFTVSDLRMAFQMQKYYEALARGGSRYIEVIKSYFGVDSPDSRLQRPEYLGGNRVPIIVDQVTNTAQTSSDVLGDVGAFSRTSDYHSDFTHSFVEHGTLMCLMVLRYDHTYCQGIPRWMKRDTKFDYYWPTFAHISEQPVDRDSIYCGASGTFGYNEAWAEYRYAPNRLAGEMRPYVSGSLGSWHLGDDYNAAPSLSDAWIREDKTNVDRVLSVTSTAANQYWCDMYFNTWYTRPMPLYSVPGLIDHF